MARAGAALAATQPGTITAAHASGILQEEGELGGWVDPDVSEPEEPPGLKPDGWDQVDAVGGWSAFLCKFRVLQYVPEQHSEMWGWAWGHVLRRISGAEGKQLERRLKWLCTLPQLLLRAPRRGVSQVGET